MRRNRQTVEELLTSLSALEVSWEDDHASTVIKLLAAIPQRPTFTKGDVAVILDADFHSGMTVMRLFLDLSKDQFQMLMSATDGGVSVTRYRKDPAPIIDALVDLGILNAMQAASDRRMVWQDVLVERLKSGRGSAIRGQRRGRLLEDMVESVLQRVFADVGYETRCRFRGATGLSDEKADFAIPSKEDPRILIEAKGYAATGSKQTDIIGVISRIAHEKRHDTHFLLVTDGLTWRLRKSDFRKLVQEQNKGLIARIYTQSMMPEFEADLRQLRKDHDL